MSGPRKTILCIEDDRETAALIAEELREHGFAVGLAYDGHEGLDAIVNRAPDLVLCDVNLPGMSGFGVLQRVKELAPDFSHMPFVFLTALADRGSELKGWLLGADDYVTKPIDFEMLVAIIKARLAREPAKPRPLNRVALTERELETLTWAARGKTSSEIATILGLSERTVNFHCDQAMKRLDVTNRAQAVAKAVSEQLLSL